MSKKSKDRLRDPALKLNMRDHATYPLTFLTYLYFVSCIIQLSKKT